MNIKAMKEKKNNLIAQAEKLLNVAVEETRSLENEEQTQYETLQDEIRQLTETIAETEARAIADAEVEVIENKAEERGHENMEINKDLEVRAIEQYIRNIDGEELRAVTSTTASSNGGIIPESVFGEVIKRLPEVAPLFSKARLFTPVTGNLSIPMEDATNIAAGAFVGEDQALSASALTFKVAKLTQKRAGAAVQLTQQLINDSGIEIVSYTIDNLVRRLGFALDRAIVSGNGTDSFKGLETLTAAANGIGEASTKTTLVVEADDFVNAYNKMHPAYIDGAVWVVSRETYNALSQLKYTDGRHVLFTDFAAEKPQYKVLGLPVVISDAMPVVAAGKAVAYLVNMNAAYGAMVKKGAELKRVSSDSATALGGTQLFVIDCYADANLINGQAVVKLASK